MLYWNLERLTEHPFLARRWFYSLPPGLLRLLEADDANKRIDASLWSEELELGALAETLGVVGFRNGLLIYDRMLVAKSLEVQGIARQTLDDWGYSGAERASFLKLIANRTGFEQGTRLGYCGWLFANPTFRSELEGLQKAMPELLQPDGESLFAIGPAASVPDSQLIRREVRDLAPLDVFLRRWRLSYIAGPRTVEPLGRQDGSPLSDLDLARARTVGRFSFLPDITRLPPRDEVREREEQSIRFTARSADHLREWIDLVESMSQGKKAIARWGRIRRLQHYWGVLHDRHGDALNRLGLKVREAFAKWLAISRETLDDDLRLLRGQLGRID